MGPSASPSALGPAPGTGPTWLGGAAVGSGDIGTGSMSGLLQLSAVVVSSSDWLSGSCLYETGLPTNGT